MKTQRNLLRLKQRFNQKLSVYENTFTKVLLVTDPKYPGKQMIAYCVIELMNTYRAFNRTLLECSMIGTKTCSGRKISIPGVKTEFDFISAVLPIYKKSVNTTLSTWNSRDEPAWEADINYLANKLQVKNQNEINNAFTISGFYKEVKVFRNFLCHRSRMLFEDVSKISRQYLITGNSVEKILLSKKNNGSYLIYDWISQCRNYADYAAK